MAVVYFKMKFGPSETSMYLKIKLEFPESIIPSHRSLSIRMPGRGIWKRVTFCPQVTLNPLEQSYQELSPGSLLHQGYHKANVDITMTQQECRSRKTFYKTDVKT